VWDIAIDVQFSSADLSIYSCRCQHCGKDTSLLDYRFHGESASVSMTNNIDMQLDSSNMIENVIENNYTQHTH